jgi:hypothetical protein
VSQLPKLKVKKEAWKNTAEIQNFEQAKDFPFGAEMIIVVEGRQVNSYEELLKLAQQESFKRKRILEVLFLPLISGG